MMAQHFSVLGDKISRLKGTEFPALFFFPGTLTVALDEFSVIAVGHEADILAVMLVGIEKAVGLGDFSRFRLFIGS